METMRIRPRAGDVATLLAALALAATWLAVHAQVLGFDFVNWDDDRFVLGIGSIREPAAAGWRARVLTPELGYPIPITRLWFAALWSLFGLEPAAWHAAGLALHLGGVACFALLSRRLLGSWTAALPATAALLHPVGAEPVAWISGQKDLLATLLATAGVLAAATSPGAAESPSRSAFRATLSTLLVTAGIASKPSVALFGLVAAVAWRSEPGALRRRLRLAIALVPTAFGGASALLTAAMQRDLGAFRAASSIAERVGMVASLTLSATKRLLWPTHLSPTYDISPAPPGSVGFVLGLALSVVGGLGLVWLMCRSRRPGHRVGAAWVLAAWLPVSGVAGSLARGTSDSYVALWLPGLALLVGASLAGWLERAARAASDAGDGSARTGGPGAARVASPLVAVALLGMLAPIRAVALQPWRNSVTLWEHAWEVSGPLPWVCRNLGYAHVFAADGSLPTQPEPYLRAHAVWSTCPERNAGNLERAEQILLERWGLAPPGPPPPRGGEAPARAN